MSHFLAALEFRCKQNSSPTAWHDFASARQSGMTKVKPVPKPARPRHFIRQWRKHRGYTQTQLADMVGVSDGAISQLERGDVNYTQPMLEAIAAALACEPADLVMRDPTDTSAPWSIMDQLQKADEPTRRRILRAVEALLMDGTEG